MKVNLLFYHKSLIVVLNGGLTAFVIAFAMALTENKEIKINIFCKKFFFV